MGTRGAAVSAETWQNPNPIVQLTELAPEARDAYKGNFNTCLSNNFLNLKISCREKIKK